MSTQAETKLQIKMHEWNGGGWLENEDEEELMKAKVQEAFSRRDRESSNGGTQKKLRQGMRLPMEKSVLYISASFT